jgi:aldehyde dehydrogenase (NAD+)
MTKLTLPRTQLLIDGDWGDAEDGRRFSTLNPADETPITEVSLGGKADIDKAVKAARRALESGPWATMTGAERGRILNRLAAIFRERMDEIVLLESIDAGKPLAATKRQDVNAAIDTIEHFAGWADKLAGEVIPVRNDALTFSRRAPVGVVAAIVPWNFPLMNAVWKTAPALACGCTVVLKPAQLTPLSALWLGAAALEAGVPPGVLNIVPGAGTDAGSALVSHPGINKIAFTGSPGVGRGIMRAAAENVTHVGLELGGKAPIVVFSDANIDKAVRATTAGAFFNAGQVCSAATRVVVEDSIHDEFVNRLTERVLALRVGDPLKEGTTMGPVISKGAMEGILNYIDIGKSEGATVATGGGRHGNQGYYVAPTLFTNAHEDMRIVQEEIFGPVLSVIRFRNDDEDEAVRIANNSIFSLASAVWTRDIDRAHRVSSRLHSGMVWVNTYGPTDARLPWGGLGGASGIGRDLGLAALEAYTERRTVWMQFGAAPKPSGDR